MKRIDLAISKVTEFLMDSDERTREFVKSVLESVKVENEDNIMAQIQVGHIDTITADISEYAYGEDYAVITFDRYRDEEGNEFESHEHARDYYEHQLRELWKIKKEFVVRNADGDGYYGSFDSFDDVVDYLESKGDYYFGDDGVSIKPYYFIYNEFEDVIGDETGYEDENSAEDEFEYLLEERVKDLVENLEESEPDEVMWDIVWNYNDMDIDVGLARMCNLAVVRFERGQFEGKTFLALQGCGMDLTPQLVAYKALKFGYITERDAQAYFSTKEKRDYFKYVVGKGFARRVYEALSIEKFFDEVEE